MSTTWSQAQCLRKPPSIFASSSARHAEIQRNALTVSKIFVYVRSFLTYQLTMALHVETSWCPYQLFHRTFTVNLTTSFVSCQRCAVYTTFVGNSVLSFTTSELNYVHDEQEEGPWWIFKFLHFDFDLWIEVQTTTQKTVSENVGFDWEHDRSKICLCLCQL